MKRILSCLVCLLVLGGVNAQLIPYQYIKGDTTSNLYLRTSSVDSPRFELVHIDSIDTDTDTQIDSITFANNKVYIWDGGAKKDSADLSSLSASEVNDLTAAVTWANVPDANITESSVTQHEAALTITESQISDLAHTVDTDTQIDSITFAGTKIYIWDGGAKVDSADISAIQDGTGTDDQNLDVGTFNTTTGVLDIGIEDGADVAVDLDGKYNNIADTAAMLAPYLAIADTAAMLSSYLTSETDDQTIDTFRIVSNTLELSLESDAQAKKTVDLSPYLDDTDTRVDSTDFNGTSNHLRLWDLGSIIDSTDLSTLAGGGAHASTHTTGQSDEIDGDKLDIDWTPSNYTPSTTPTEADNVDNLTAHLYGIDQALTGGGGGISDGDAITGGTNETVLIKDATGNLDASTTLYFEQTTQRLSVNDASPTANLHVNAPSTTRENYFHAEQADAATGSVGVGNGTATSGDIAPMWYGATSDARNANTFLGGVTSTNDTGTPNKYCVLISARRVSNDNDPLAATYSAVQAYDLFGVQNYTTTYFLIDKDGNIESGSATGYWQIPDGSTAQRANNGAGTIRWNTDNDIMDVHDGVNYYGLNHEVTTHLSADTIDLAVVAEKTLFYTDKDITLQSIRAVNIGGSSPSVQYTLKFASDRSAAGTNAVNTTTITNTTTGATGSFADATIPSGNYIWVEFGTVSGDPDEFSIDLKYTYD